MSFTHALAVVLVVSMASPDLFAQSTPTAATADLPVSLDRIRKGLEKTPALELVPLRREDLPRFYAEVVGTPSFDTFLQNFDLVNGPVPYGGMTHREFLSMVTPKELYSSAGFGAAEVLQAAIMFKGIEWLARKAVAGAIDAKRASELNAVRSQIKVELGAIAQARAQQAVSGDPDVSALVWLAGCWLGSTAGRLVEEQWMAPRGGTLLGTSRTVVDERTTEYEFLQIRQQDDGVFFVARPSGQAEASFRLVTAAAGLASEAVFEDPTHDFPQRVIYRLQPDGSLLARIEGTKDGAPLAADFPMRRVTCR